MARCENCINALIGRSRIVEPIDNHSRWSSGWAIEEIDCKLKRKTQTYSDITCSDFIRRVDDGRE